MLSLRLVLGLPHGRTRRSATASPWGLARLLHSLVRVSRRGTGDRLNASYLGAADETAGNLRPADRRTRPEGRHGDGPTERRLRRNRPTGGRRRPLPLGRGTAPVTKRNDVPLTLPGESPRRRSRRAVRPSRTRRTGRHLPGERSTADLPLADGHRVRRRSARFPARGPAEPTPDGPPRHPGLPSQRFHALLNSLFKVLFTFPSRYLSAIGLAPVFSLGWSLPPDLSCIPKQLDSTSASSRPVAPGF